MIQKTHKLGFGKHKGKTVQEILEIDPTYIRWLINNVETFVMSPEDTKFVLELACKADCNYYSGYYSECYGTTDIYDYSEYYGTIDVYDYCD